MSERRVVLIARKVPAELATVMGSVAYNALTGGSQPFRVGLPIEGGLGRGYESGNTPTPLIAWSLVVSTEDECARRFVQQLVVAGLLRRFIWRDEIETDDEFMVRWKNAVGWVDAVRTGRDVT